MDLSFSNQTQLRVRYSETDQMGYCYYGNYAQFLEIGRVEAMRSAGMSYREMEDNGVMLPVTEFKINYFSPALYDDLLTVTTFIKTIKGARLFFEYEIHNEKGDLVVKAHTTLVFVAKENMKPIKAPTEFMELLKPYEI